MDGYTHYTNSGTNKLKERVHKLYPFLALGKLEVKGPGPDTGRSQAHVSAPGGEVGGDEGQGEGEGEQEPAPEGGPGQGAVSHHAVPGEVLAKRWC